MKFSAAVQYWCQKHQEVVPCLMFLKFWKHKLNQANRMEWLVLGQELNGGCKLCRSKKLKSWLWEVYSIRWKMARGKQFIARFKFFLKEEHLAVRTSGTYIFISNLKNIDTCTWNQHGITLSWTYDDFKCQNKSMKRKGRKPTPKCRGKKWWAIEKHCQSHISKKKLRNIHNNNFKLTWKRVYHNLRWSLTKHSTITLITNNNDELSRLPNDFISSCNFVTFMEGARKLDHDAA